MTRPVMCLIRSFDTSQSISLEGTSFKQREALRSSWPHGHVSPGARRVDEDHWQPDSGQLKPEFYPAFATTSQDRRGFRAAGVPVSMLTIQRARFEPDSYRA